MIKKVVVAGAGPAGLFCSYLLLKKNFQVDLYDHSSGVGKKFLIAGNGGLNLTHSEDLKSFAARYGKDEQIFSQLLKEFGPDDLRAFCSELGVETFVGSSGRVFPEKLKAAQILLNWIKALKANPNFKLYLKHSLVDITKDKKLVFKNPETQVPISADIIILALGGASWKKTGSDGKWKTFLDKLGIGTVAFRPMNCGFERPWSEHFIKSVGRAPLKNVEVFFKDKSSRGEVMLTPYGLEGGGIYALSNHIRDELERGAGAKIFIDLKPGLSKNSVLEKLEKRKPKDSLSNHLRKNLGLGSVENILLKELASKEDYQNPKTLAGYIKRLGIDLTAPRPIDEAISTSGGAPFEALDQNFQLKKLPGVYIVGEMLDFEAPTGGYLLQGCFSTARRAVKGITG